MAQGYRTKSTRLPFLGGIKSLIIIGIAFVAGYWCSLWSDNSNLIEWVKGLQQVLTHTEELKNVSKANASAKPKLEFYTLLTKEDDDIINTTSNTPTVIANVPAGVLRANSPVKSTANTANKIVSTEIKTPVAIKPTAIKTPTVVPTKQLAKGSYLIQLAAFRARSDAEKMKANLVLKGFDVRITAITQTRGQNWFRVMIGPYASKERATKALSNLAKTEHVTGMIRFVNA